MKNSQKWLIPFKGRNYSGATYQNFLWKDDDKKIYIMDNHRSALWCWLQEIDLKQKIHYFHLDRHYDCLNANLDVWLNYCSDIEQMSISDYLELKYDKEYPVFLWDNYGSIFLKKYENIIQHSLFLTYKEGDNPRTASISEENAVDLLENLEYWTDRGNWIFNIDLDYFFYKQGDIYYQMYSDEFISTFFKIVKVKIDRDEIKVTTIALSPECCGGWKNAERVCSIASKELLIDFTLNN